jgi:hypothetical protein
VTILTTTTGLLRILAVHINGLGEGLFVSNLRSTYISLYLEFTQQTVYDDLQMQLAHAGDDGLACLLIGMLTEGRIFFCKLCKSNAHLILTCFGLRLDCQLNNGFREFHGLQDYRMLLITDGITGCSKLKAYCSSDITGINLFQLHSLVCMHLQDTSNTFLFIFCCIQHIRTSVHSTGIHTEVSKLTYEGVCHDLECQSRKRLFIRRMSDNLVAFQIHTFNRRDIKRRRHILYDCIQKLLHALVLVCASAAYRNSGTFAGAFSQSCFQLVNRGLLTFQISHHQIVIQLADLLYHLRTIQLSFVLHIFRDINDRNIIALIVIVDVGFHFEQIDQTLKVFFFTDGQLNTDCVLAQTGFDLLYCAIKVCTQDIHLIDECHTGYIVGISLTPYVLRLRFYTALCTEHADSAVQYTQGTLNFYCEVNVSRGINDIDTALFCAGLCFAIFLQGPVTGGSSRSNCNTSLLLLSHPVHGCSTFMSITNFIVNTGIIQDTLGGGSFTSIDVSHNTDISGSL